MVYFVQAETLRLIKIGVTNDIETRLAGFRVGSPDRLTLLGVLKHKEAAKLEAKLHAKFWAHHHHGEWFEPAPELLAEAFAVRPSAAYEPEIRAALESVVRYG